MSHPYSQDYESEEVCTANSVSSNSAGGVPDASFGKLYPSEEELKESYELLVKQLKEHPWILSFNLFTVEDERKLIEMRCLDGPARPPWSSENPCEHGNPEFRCMECNPPLGV